MHYSQLEGSDLRADRREQQCNSNESLLRVELMTDRYAWETSFVVKDPNNKKIFDYPAEGTNFASESRYVDSECVPPGTYSLRLKDSSGDGFCCSKIYGDGYFKVSVNGINVLTVEDDFKGTSKDYNFVVAPGSGRGGVSNGNGNGFQQQTCYDVKVVTKVDKYGKETSFKIKTRNGSNVAMSMGPVIPAGETKSVSDCLAPGEYTLIFEDPDGICCAYGDGYFELYVEGEKLITGGRFRQQIKHDFILGYDWESTMNARDEEFLVAHNARRRDWHGRFNKPYRPLKWSTGLADDAKSYAEELLNTCEENGIKHKQGIDQGENLAKNRGSGAWGELYPADNLVKRWIDNEEFWGWNANAHLTQALWYATRYIGCGESVKNMSNGQTCRMQVCRFAKAGNCMMGQYVNKDGSGWEEPMMMDDSPCGPMCPPGGCFI